jgi:hypothetical protein
VTLVPRKVLPPQVYGPEHGFQPDTKVNRWVCNYVFNEEGMGGFVNYTGVTTWIAKNCPWVEGRVWCEQFLVPLLKDIHEPYPQFKVLPSNQMAQLLEPGTSTIGPGLALSGKEQSRQFFTCLGAHPFDVGFAYFITTCPAPADAYLPVLDYPVERLQPKLKRLAKKYVVFTCGGTTQIRTMQGSHINPLIEHVKALGLTPVFLGKRDLLGTGKVTTSFADDTKYSEGIDLRDQTSVKDAALIMQHAACTVGLDGGLLHLAALMKDSRIVFGYNITSIEHRVPRRTHGKTVNVTLTKAELPCIGCQSQWKSIPNHTYDKCFYRDDPTRDSMCLKLLFNNDSARFRAAIDEVLQ